MKKIILFVLSVIMFSFSVFKLAPSYSSDAALYYDKDNNKMVYYNLDKDDIFSSFKELIPGDIKSETINIKNNNTKIYMRIDDENNEEINEAFIIKVYKDDSEILASGGYYEICSELDTEVSIKLYVEIPTTVGNEMTSFTNQYDIFFYIEGDEVEEPESPDDNGNNNNNNNENQPSDDELVEVPKTYEKSITIYYLLLLASIALFIISIISILKNKKHSSV